MQSNTLTYKNTFILLTLLLVLCFVLNLSLGSVLYSVSEVLNASFGNSNNTTLQQIIFQYRLPKAITAIVAGSGLGISGLLMQTLFKNPLAGPFVLGITSGASLGVAICIMGVSFLGVFLGIEMVSKLHIVISACIGSFGVLLIVLGFSTRVKDIMSILIIGLMFGSISSALVNVFSYFSTAEALQQFVFWGFGSLSHLSWQEILILSSVYAIGVLLSIFSIKPLNTLLLGENYAKSLGLNLKQSRLIIILATSLLAGTITAFTGPIVFIGLAIPHIARLFFNTTNHRILIPAVFLIGAIVMLICDIIAQLPGSAYTLPINVVTSLIGAPIVIWFLVRKQKLIF